MKRLFFTLIFALFLCNLGNAQSEVIDPELELVLKEKGNEMISINIIFKSQMETAVLNAGTSKLGDKESKREYVITELKKYSEENQRDVMSILKAEESAKNVTSITSHWIVNSINCEASADVIYSLSEHPDIKVLLYNKMEQLIWDDKGEKVSPSRGVTENVIQVNADDVWGLGTTGEGVIVAVLDTGVNYNHVDLKDHLWNGGSNYPNHGWDFINNDNDPMDDDSHGTHCAGTICGDGTSGTQTGMAPDATLMCVKVMGPDGGTADALVNGIEFSVENGADVLSLSLGFRNPSESISAYMRDIFVNVLNAGVVASVAAGNDRDDIASYPIPKNVHAPGNCPPPWLHPDQQSNAGGMSAVVCVGAVDYSDEPASFSSEGPVTWQQTSYGDYPLNIINEEDGWIFYDDGVNVDGIGGPTSFFWGVQFPVEVMANYAGNYLTSVSMYDRVATTGGQIRIYQGGTKAPGTLVHTQYYSGTGSGTFVEYELTASIPVDETQSLWIVMNTAMGTVYPASCSNNTGDHNVRWISMDGSVWDDLIDYDLSYTWMLCGFVTNEAKGEVSELKPIEIEYIANNGTLSESNTFKASGYNSKTENYFGLIRPDVSAPGVSIVSCAYDDNYGFYTMSGTSMATPCTAGVMALLLSKDPSLTPSDICRILETTSVPLSTTKSNRTGSGRIDAYSAIQSIDNVINVTVDSYDPSVINADDNETINIILKNSGVETLTGVTEIRLTSDDPYITIVDGTTTVGEIAPNATINVQFTIKADETTPDDYRANLGITVENNGKSCYRLLSIVVSNECIIPSNLVAETIGDDTIQLSWTASPTAEGYYIYRDNEYISYCTGTSFTDTGLSPGTNYCYKVSSKCVNGESDFSSQACSVTSGSLDAVYTSFENGYSGWTTINANNDDHTWYHSSEDGNHGTITIDSHSGSGHMMSESYCAATYAPITPDDYLVSPRLNIKNDEYVMTFWACAQDQNYAAEHFGIAVSTQGNEDASDFITIAEWTINSKADRSRPRNSKTPTPWQQYEVDLSDYAGQEIWVAIRHFNCYDKFILLVDDIEVKSYKSQSLPLVESFDDSSMPVEWHPSSIGHENWSINESNFAGGTANELRLYYSPTFDNTSRFISPYLDMREVVTIEVSFKHYLDNYSGSNVIGIATSSDDGVTWNSIWSKSYSSDGQYVVNKILSSPDFGNDRVLLCIYFEGNSYNIDNWYFDDIVIENSGAAAQSGSYSFENGFDGWTTINANEDDHTWYHNSESQTHSVMTGASHSGSGHVCSESYCYATWMAMTPDDYLVSPIKYQIEDDTFLTFWACTQDINYAAEHFGVAVSTGGNTLASDFTTIWEHTITAQIGKGGERDTKSRNQGQWYKYIVDLNDYVGQEVWIAIRHFNCYDQFMLLIDDIVIDAGMQVVDVFAASNPYEGGLVYGEGLYEVDSYATLSAVANEGYVFKNWTRNGEVVSTESSYTFKVTDSCQSPSAEDDFENAYFDESIWNNDVTPDYPWVISEDAYDGSYSMMSGCAGVDNSESSIYATIYVPYDGIVSFYHKVSSELTYDKGYFYIDGVEKVSISGETGWNYQEFPISKGVHTYCWKYKKDVSVSNSNDAYYVDNVMFYQDNQSTIRPIDVYVANFESVNFSRYLTSGWNWFSTYVDINGTQGFDMLTNAIGNYGIQIKSQKEFATHEYDQWFGSLNSTSVSEMYKILMDVSDYIYLVGDKVYGYDIPIQIEINWKWIGYPIDKALSVADAFASIYPSDGDYIKSQSGFSQYYSNMGWVGNLNTLVPGEGYMYYNTSGIDKTLYYPNLNSKEELKANITTSHNYWKPNVTKYADNMSIIALVNFNREEMSDYEIGAFSNGECRGSARPIYIEELSSYMIFLTVYGEDNDDISFKYYDTKTNSEYRFEADNTVVFTDNGILGTIVEPYILNFGITGVDEYSDNSFAVFPNPADRNKEISLGVHCEYVEVFSSVGIKVAEYQNVETIKGVDVSGTYIIKITNNNEIMYCKLVIK